MTTALHPSKIIPLFVLCNAPEILHEDTVLALDTETYSEHENYDNNAGYYFAEHSAENMSRLIPKTTYVDNDQRLLLVIENKNANGTSTLKAAFMHSYTGRISLVTSSDNIAMIMRQHNKTQFAHDEFWAIGKDTPMSAPVFFWRELQNRLIY